MIPKTGMRVHGMLSGYSCCTTNLRQGWPKFTQHLWVRSTDGGLAALAYAPNRVTTLIEGITVSIQERTDYPFDETLRFSIECSAPVAFPLHLRILGWCDKAEIRVNGQPVAGPAPVGSIHVLSRPWRSGDQVELILPMNVRKSFWYERSVTIERRPLVYALRIEEKWLDVNQGDRRLGYRECRPRSPWNYALSSSMLDHMDSGFSVVRKASPLAANRWTIEGAPIELRTKAARIPEWTLYNGSAGRVPKSPLPRSGSR